MGVGYTASQLLVLQNQTSQLTRSTNFFSSAGVLLLHQLYKYHSGKYSLQWRLHLSPPFLLNSRPPSLPPCFEA
jgi:hypothetical protein